MNESYLPSPTAMRLQNKLFFGNSVCTLKKTNVSINCETSSRLRPKPELAIKSFVCLSLLSITLVYQYHSDFHHYYLSHFISQGWWMKLHLQKARSLYFSNDMSHILCFKIMIYLGKMAIYSFSLINVACNIYIV